MKLKVNAKLNLTLDVNGTTDGYHNLDSLVVSVDIYDTVSVNARDDGNVTVTGTDAINLTDNSAYKAAVKFSEVFCSNGVDIVVEKGIPFASGLGGSSADAAAVIYAMALLFDVSLENPAILDVCRAVGSDVEYMLRGGFCRLRGRGYVERRYNDVNLHFCLTAFSAAMESKRVFAEYDRLADFNVHCDNSLVANALLSGNIGSASQIAVNVLETAVCSLSEYADDYLKFCKENGLTVHMTGSGSAYFVLCNSADEAAEVCSKLASAGFSSVVCKSVGQGVEIIH
ncbi:MAG: hypothetical protein NC350_06380 [Corallococcus sp.]|nr:hypothetical protein [Corallococcus sp.]